MADWVGLFARYSVGVQPPCAADAMHRAESALGFALPNDLQELFGLSDGLFDRAGQWWFIWPIERLIADTLALRSDLGSTLPDDVIAFGDDGAGTPFCLIPSSGESVYCRSPIDGRLRMLAGGLDEFLVGWLSGTITT